MHAPQWVLNELVRVSPWARLGWQGRARGPGDGLNHGEFVLLDLIKARLIDRTFKEPWADRGPVYGPCYDRLMRIPVMVKSYNAYEVYGGAIIADVRRMRTPLQQRITESWNKHQKAYRDEIHDLAGQIGSELYWTAQRGGDGAPTYLPKKDITAHEKEVLTGEWKQHVPNAPAPRVPLVAAV